MKQNLQILAALGYSHHWCTETNKKKRVAQSGAMWLFLNEFSRCQIEVKVAGNPTRVNTHIGDNVEGKVTSLMGLIKIKYNVYGDEYWGAGGLFKCCRFVNGKPNSQLAFALQSPL